MLFSILTVIWHYLVNKLDFLPENIRMFLHENSWIAWIMAFALGILILSFLFSGCNEWGPGPY